jgi:two-component system LytT family response regulator
MRAIRCIIVDDEPLALDILDGYIIKTPFLEFAGRCSSAEEAMNIMAQATVELIFLDIQMPDLNGIEFSRVLKNGPKIIFTTAFEQYALEGYRVDALDYLMKPISYVEFLRAAVKARDWFAHQMPKIATITDEECIYVKSEYKQVRIAIKELLFAEGMKDYAKLYIEGKERPVLTIMTLKELENLLPQAVFMRVHRSFIVNLNKIEAVERTRLNIAGRYISIADNYKEHFREYISGKSK